MDKDNQIVTLKRLLYDALEILSVQEDGYSDKFDNIKEFHSNLQQCLQSLEKESL